MDVNLQMTTMIVGEEEAITLNRTTVSENFTFSIVYVTTTTKLTIVYAYFVIASFGILGSLVTMGKILHEPKLHTPTFAVIGYLALADFLSVIAFTFFYFTNYKFVKSFAICFYAFYVNSSFHVVLLSTVRYFIILYPLKSRQHLTINKISLTSLLVMFISSLFAVVISDIYDISDMYASMVNCVLVAIEIVIVCSILIALHVKKLISIHSSPSLTVHTERRMNAVFTAIIIIFVIFHACHLIKALYEYLVIYEYVSYDSNTLLLLQYIYLLTACINYSCNPYILFLPLIVHSCISKIKICCNDN